jgi:membrane-associated protein
MSFLQGLHGTIAVLLLCALLFVDEAGVPLPIAPNEVLLVIGGLLIATGAMPAWVFLPAAAVAMTAGMVVGYGWARAAGGPALEALAGRIGVTAAYRRVQRRLQHAGLLGIGLSRLIPGVRPYVTVVSGAARVDPRTFFLGALPALLIWEAALTTLGVLVGLPAERFLTRFQQFGLSGGLLIILGGVSYLAVRRVSGDRADPLEHLPLAARVGLALTIDAGMVSSIVAGLFAVGRRLLGLTTRGWVDLVVIVAIVIVAYVVVARRGAGGTAGEALLRVDYRDLGATVRTGAPSAQPDLDSEAVAALLRPLADPVRVRIVLLLGMGLEERDDLLTRLQLSRSLLTAHLSRLSRAGLVTARDRDGHCHYEVSDPAVLRSLELLGELTRRGA